MFKIEDKLVLISETPDWYGNDYNNKLKIGDKVVVSSYEYDPNEYGGVGAYKYGFKDICDSKTEWISHFVEKDFKLDIKFERKSKIGKIYESIC